MLETYGYAALGPKAKLAPYKFNRREPGPKDVLIEILYSGICHSDIHQARDEWGGSTFPMVPGHEIAGRVMRVGAKVKRFREGDHAGVGCFVDSCRKCASCAEGLQQYCEGHLSFTYNGTEPNKKTPTQGGYSNQIVVDENYVLKLSKKIPLAKAAPLLCAGITTFSPLRNFGVKRGQKVGVIGLGGLGHMAVKFAAAMGAEVTVFSTSKAKEKDARAFGAKHFCLTSNPKNLSPLANYFDFILNSASAVLDLGAYLGLLKRDGTLCLVGAPDKPAELNAFPLILKRRRLAGSLIGGLMETQEMLDFCAKKNITPEVEIIPIQKVNEAYELTVRGKVRYRFVIDMKSLEKRA